MAVAVWKSLCTGGSPTQDYNNTGVTCCVRSSHTYHQLPAITAQVQAVNILTEPFNDLLVTTKDIHVVSYEKDV